jgi:hypothetical protein
MSSKTTVGGFEPKYVAINTASASQELVAAIAGSVIRVIGLYLTSDVAQIVSLKSATTEIASFRFSLLTSGGLPHINLTPNQIGYCETSSGEALNLAQASTNNADGLLVYIVSPA